MKGIVIGEFSGTVRDAFNERGHQFVSCDLLPTESEGPHIEGDVFKEGILFSSYDIAICHPPCTYLCNSGVSWLHKDPDRWGQLDEGAAFFKKLLELPIAKIAIENPIPHKYAVERIGRKYDQLVQPWQFGHGETKATCFWLKNLPKLTPTDVVEGREQRLHRLPPTADRGKLRSITYQGIAEAMADQWGDL